MGRYIIIDTKAALGLASDNAYDQTGTYRGEILSEEETLSKFKEVWNAGYSKFEDYACGSGDKTPDWSEFSKTL